MSRLDDEFIMAVVRNRSGMDSGDLDFMIHCSGFDALDRSSLFDVIVLLQFLAKRCQVRIEELEPR